VLDAGRVSSPADAARFLDGPDRTSPEESSP
jgi:hypothetical protein